MLIHQSSFIFNNNNLFHHKHFINFINSRSKQECSSIVNSKEMHKKQEFYFLYCGLKGLLALYFVSTNKIHVCDWACKNQVYLHNFHMFRNWQFSWSSFLVNMICKLCLLSNWFVNAAWNFQYYFKITLKVIAS